MDAIPATLLKQEAMLATRSKGNPAELAARMTVTGRFLWQPKWDGVRTLVYVDHGQVLLRSRTGHDDTARYPEVVAQLAATYPKDCVVFDGELICFDPATGLPSFNRIQKRVNVTKPTSIKMLSTSIPTTLMVFDLLWHNGDDLRGQPLQRRLDQLRLHDERMTSQRVLPTATSVDGSRLWSFVEQHGLEGLIAKEKQGRYTGRRDSGWVKLKRLKRCTAIVTGYEPGKGARRGKIGALLISVLDDAGALVPIGKAGTGLKESDHGPLLEVLNAGQQFLAEIEYLGLTPNGELRMPVFIGVRSDVTRDQCVLSQVRS